VLGFGFGAVVVGAPLGPPHPATNKAAVTAPAARILVCEERMS